MKCSMGFWVVLILAVVFILFFLSPLVLRWIAPSGWEEIAHLGDAYGVVNTLFSGLAFAFLVLALVMQQGELNEQPGPDIGG